MANNYRLLTKPKGREVGDDALSNICVKTVYVTTPNSKYLNTNTYQTTHHEKKTLKVIILSKQENLSQLFVELNHVKA